MRYLYQFYHSPNRITLWHASGHFIADGLISLTDACRTGAEADGVRGALFPLTGFDFFTYSEDPAPPGVWVPPQKMIDDMRKNTNNLRRKPKPKKPSRSKK